CAVASDENGYFRSTGAIAAHSARDPLLIAVAPKLRSIGSTLAIGASIKVCTISCVRVVGFGVNVLAICSAALFAPAALLPASAIAASAAGPAAAATFSSEPCSASSAVMYGMFCGPINLSVIVGGVTACTGWNACATSGKPAGAVFCDA